MASQAMQEDLIGHQRAVAEVDDSGLVGTSSKYEENVLFGSHTQVWGSYYEKETGKWGYKCCKGMQRAEKNCSQNQSKSSLIQGLKV